MEIGTASIMQLLDMSENGSQWVPKTPKEPVCELDAQNFQEMMYGQSLYQNHAHEIAAALEVDVEKNAVNNLLDSVVGNVGDLKEKADSCLDRINTKLEMPGELSIPEMLELQWAAVNYSFGVNMMTNCVSKGCEGIKTMIRQA